MRKTLILLLILSFSFLIASASYAAGYKGVEIGQAISTLPKEINCSVVFCEGTFRGDFWRVGTLDGKVLNFDIIYVGSSFDQSVSVSRNITLAESIRVHSLQPGHAPPDFGLAKDNQDRTYGIVDRANAIVYGVIGTATDPSSVVTTVSYLSRDAPVLHARAIAETAALVKAAQAVKAHEEAIVTSGLDSGKMPDTAVTPAKSGPFGFTKGMTREQIIKLVGESAIGKEYSKGDVLFLNTAPKPNPAFEAYVLVISPTDGLLKVHGMGHDIRTGEDGVDLRAEFDRIVAGVTQRYGAPTKTYDLCTGNDVECGEPRFWMMALEDKNRALRAYWGLSPGGPVESVSVEVTARDLHTGYVRYDCELAGFSAYADQKEAKENQNY